MNSKAYASASVLALAAWAALVAGCASAPVALPVAECPAPAPVVLPTRPPLEIQRLPADAGQAAVLQAYVASLHQCVGYADELRTLVGPRRTAQP